MVKIIRRRLKRKKSQQLKITRDRRGFIQTITNPKGKGTAFIVQGGRKTGFTVVTGRTNKTRKEIGFGKTEASAIASALRKKKRRIVFLD